MNTAAVRFSSREDLVASLRSSLTSCETRLAGKDAQIAARESKVRLLRVEEAQRATEWERLGFASPASKAGRDGLDLVRSEMREVRHQVNILRNSKKPIEAEAVEYRLAIEAEERVIEAAAP